MDNRIIFEIIGYAGTALLLTSFLMSSVYKLRIINTIGSLVTIVYALLVKVYPTVLLNAALAVINVVYLWKLASDKGEKIYKAGVVPADDPVIAFFISQHVKDIGKYFPSFDYQCFDLNKGVCVFYEDTIAGVLLGKQDTNGELIIKLDYTIPAYRDFSVGKYLYRELKNSGVTKCIFEADIPKSYVYLRKMGFKRNGDRMELDM